MSILTQGQKVAQWKQNFGDNVTMCFPFAHFETKRFLDIAGNRELVDNDAVYDATVSGQSNLLIASGALASGAVPNLLTKNSILFAKGKVIFNTAFNVYVLGGDGTTPSGFSANLNATGGTITSDADNAVSVSNGVSVNADDVITNALVIDIENETVQAIGCKNGGDVTFGSPVDIATHINSASATPNTLSLHSGAAQVSSLFGLIQPTTLPSIGEIAEAIYETSLLDPSGAKLISDKLAQM